MPEIDPPLPRPDLTRQPAVAQDVLKLMSSNIIQSLGTMLDTIVF